MAQLLLLFWKSGKNAIRSPAWTAFEVILPLVALALIFLLTIEQLQGLKQMEYSSDISLNTCTESRYGYHICTNASEDYCTVTMDISKYTVTFTVYPGGYDEIKKQDRAGLAFFPHRVPFSDYMATFVPLLFGNKTISTFLKTFYHNKQLNPYGYVDQYEHFAIPRNVMLAPSAVFLSLYVCMFVPLICAVHVARDISIERETGVKDYLLVMGMSRGYYYFHHYAFAMLKSMIAVLALALTLFMDPNTAMLSLSFFFSFLLFVSAFIAIGLCIGALIKRPTIATLSSMLIMLAVTTIAVVWHANRNDIALSIFSYISPAHAMHNILDEISESWYRGGQINIGDMKTVAGYLEALLMLVIMNVLFICLAVLLDFLSSSTDSVWGMIATKFGIGLRKSNEGDEETFEIADAIEKDAYLDKLPVDIHLEDVHKIWSNGEHAVRGIDLKVYRGQVTVLLGHNGAGKSTTFAMIAGIEVPSKGKMRIGEEIVNDGEKASIGFCPQYNPMFPKLTVLENLRFFAKLKGQNSNWDEDRTRLVNTLQLSEHIDVQARNLSGGQKRKLCVAISLIGGSQVILLDEPTAGMDTGARRDMERMLAEYKSEKTFLMTTHYTDEAENLGDRIVIMAGGKIVCSGSPQFLNKRFEAGYVLSAVTSAGTAMAETSGALLSHVQTVVPAAKLQRQHGQQIEIWMPKDETPKFAELFRGLEAAGAPLGIESFGMSMNTLEQVFLKVGELTGTKNREQEVRGAIDDLLEQNENRAARRFLKGLGAGIYKRALYDKAHIPGHVIILILLVAIIAAGKLVTQAFSGNSKPSSTPLGNLDWTLSDDFCIRVGARGDDSFIKNMTQSAANQKRCIEIVKTDDVKGWYEKERWNRPVIAAGVEFVQNSGCNCSKATPNTMDLVFNLPSNLNPAYAVISLVFNAITGQQLTFNAARPHERDEYQQKYTHYPRFQVALVVAVFIALPIATFRIVGFYIVDRMSKFAHQQMLTGMGRLTYWLASFVWDMLVFVVQFCFIIGTVFAVGVLEDDPDLRLRFLLMLPLYFIVAILRSYFVSFFFESKPKAEAFLLLSTLIAAAGFGIGFWLRASVESSIMWIVVGWIDPTIPMLLPMMELLSEGGSLSVATIYGFVLLLVQIALYIALILLKLNMKKCCKSAKVAPVDNGKDYIEPEVAAEKRAIEEGMQQDLVLEVNSLVKWYGKKNCAVRGISFGVHAHECFGLLGTNGAGKTSAFEILTGNATASSGSAIVAGVNCADMATIGYCPQFDALLPDLTGYQCLRILAAMHGYADPGRVADLIVNCVGMREHGDKKTATYSGGQRRKISVGVALLAQNSLIILDEPTAGIDPVARRDIWTVLVALRDRTQTAIVLTSHSMDEVEALCSRVAILKRGRIVALGSAQALKTKYGDHYKLAIVLQKLEPLDKVTPIVQAHFPRASLIPGAATRTINFEIPREADQKWSELFDSATKVAETLGTTDYCLSQASLEDAFVAITVDSDSDAPSIYGGETTQFTNNNTISDAKTPQDEGRMPPPINAWQ